ncbi:MAG: glycosyltransferase, partial [Proteobacteria bacterium]|nr:glycosyltransferase [Pseudomonadota bacterium]
LQAVLQQYQPDVLVVDSITLAGGVIADISKLPWATCSSLPGMIPTRDGPPFTHWGLPPSTNGFVNLAYRLIRDGQKLFFYFFDRDFNRIRSSLGLPALHTGVITSTLSPYLLLIFTCEGFEYKRSDWPSQAHLIGPSPWGKSIDAESSYEWIDALPLDRPIIYVTLGTFQVFRSLNFFQVVMDALQDEPYQVVMRVGPAADIDALRKMAPAGFRIERFVPHERILPRVAAVIHHGGQGIAQDCIYNGIPAVVIPISQDLPEVARRCEVAGVALRIPYSRLTPKRLRTCLRTVLNDTAIQRNTKWLQQIFLNTNAGHTGADLLEQLAAQKRPIYRGTGT